MSAPEANTSSLPAITMHRTSGSASPASTAAASSSITSGESAFRASGRFSRHTNTRSSTECSTSEELLTVGLQRRHRVDPGGLAPDDQLLDLGGALVQGRDPGIAQVALHRVVVDVAGAAMYLNRGVGALHRRLGRVQLRDRGLRGVR